MSNRFSNFSKGSVLFWGVMNVLWMCGCQEDETFTQSGYKEYRDGNYDKAIQYFDSALAVVPSNTTAYLGRGNSWAEKNNVARAFEDYDKAIEIDPLFAPGYYARGYLWSEMGNISNAISDYTKAINVNSRYVSAYINRASLLRTLGGTNEAVDDYTSVLALTPKDTKAWCERGYLLFTSGRYDEGINDYLKAIDIDPKNPEIFMSRANAWYAIGNYEEAIRDCEMAVKLRSVDPAPYNGLAWLLATCPNPKFRDGGRAVDLAKKALQIVLNSSVQNHLSGVYDTMAAAYAECQLFELAMQYQSKAIQCAKDLGLADTSDYEAHMELYREGKPLRVPVPSKKAIWSRK